MLTVICTGELPVESSRRCTKGRFRKLELVGIAL